MTTIIEDLKPQKGKDGVWGFSLKYVLGPESVKSIGWRYYEESGEVAPPSIKIGKNWIKTSQASEGFLAELAEQMREKLVPSDEAEKFAVAVWSVFEKITDQERALDELESMENKNRHQWALMMILRAFRMAECRA